MSTDLLILLLCLLLMAIVVVSWASCSYTYFCHQPGLLSLSLPRLNEYPVSAGGVNRRYTNPYHLVSQCSLMPGCRTGLQRSAPTYGKQRFMTMCYINPSILLLASSIIWYWPMGVGAVCRGIARNLLGGGQNGVWGRKSPNGVQVQSPGGGLGAKPPEAGDIY